MATVNQRKRASVLPHGFWLRILVACFLCLPAVQLRAAQQDAQPHQIVEQATGDLIAAIEDAKGYFDQDPERFYTEINRILDPLVDFDGFARSVMGRYGSNRYVASLEPEERKHFVDQYRKFSTSFKQGLVRTYAKGLLNFSGEKIEVQPPRANDLDKIKRGDSVDVTQLIYGADPRPYTVILKMRPDKNDGWKLRNVTIEGVNLGQVYRSQFESAMETYKGDMDQVIVNWNVAPYDVENNKWES
jgi:phospholipid transport system substrate-binding protein